MYPTSKISEEQYKELVNKYNAYETARKELCGNRNYVTQDDSILLPENPTNEERSMIETYEFIHNPPQRYFAYVDFKGGNLTTWTGEFLGEIDFISRWRNNMGDTRYSVRVHAVNGKEYYGTYYASAGDYCRLTMKKNNK